MARAVLINDRMQRGYRYARFAPMGEAFDPGFAPELTPSKMLALGGDRGAPPRCD